MYKLLSLSIFLCFFAVQNASALTLKKGETLGSDGQIKSGAANKGAEASDTDETVIYLAWAHSHMDKPAPIIEAVDTLVFSAYSQVADSEGLVPTVKYKDMTDDYIMKGREALNIRLLNDQTLSIQGRVEVFRDEFVTINHEVSLSSKELALPLTDKQKLVISWHVPDVVQQEWKSECEGKTDKKLPKVTELDCAMKQTSQYIKLPKGTIKSRSLPSRDAAMTVTGFPGHEKAAVFRFQSITGVCAKNNWDCRPENVRTKHVRSEVVLPLKKKDRAKAGDTTIVEYDLFVPKNPHIDTITKYGDWFNFGQLHGHGDDDVPITVAVVRDDPRVKLVEAGRRTNASPIPGSLAVYLRSIAFDEVLQETGRNSAIVLAGPGEFEDRWMRIRIEVKWETTKAGRIDIRLDGNKVFECSNCVTLPVYKEAAIQNGKKGKQSVNFQFGIYSWRLQDKAYLYQDTEPPTVVAYYKNVSWKKK